MNRIDRGRVRRNARSARCGWRGKRNDVGWSERTATEAEAAERPSKAPRVFKIGASPRTTQMGAFESAPSDSRHSSDVEYTGAEPSGQPLDTPHAFDLHTCYICHGTLDQESIMRCDGPGCSVTAHLHCYFTPGSQDAEDAITDIENWHCEGCGGLPRHLHPRPPAMKQARVSFCSALTAPFDVRLGQGGSASERPGAGWGARGGGEHHPARIGTGSGKGKEPMDVDDADTWMGHADMMTNESALGNTMKTAQTQQLQAADEDEEMGLNLFDSTALTA